MKSIYEKPVVEITTVYAEPILAGTLEHGVIDTDLSKESQFEDENETGIPDSYANIWGDEEEKED